MDILTAVILVILTVLLVVFIFLYSREKRKEQILGSLDMTLFQVIMPRYELKKDDAARKDEKNLIGQMEQIFADFLYLKRPGIFKRLFQPPPRIALEIACETGGADISFYVAVPIYLETAFEKYVQGVFPRSLVEKVPEDYTIFEPGGFAAGSFLRLKEEGIFPINTYKNLEKDPLAGITNALSKISADEGAAVQLIIRPLSHQNWKKIGDKILAKIGEGKSVNTAINEVYRSPIIGFMADMFGALATKPKKREEELENLRKNEMQVNERAVQAIQEKIQKQVFETNIRLISAAQTQERADEILGHLEGSFGQFSLLSMNSFKVVERKGRALKKLIYDYSFRTFDTGQKNILNIEELASIYHFPTQYLETPYIKLVKSGAAPPPAEMPLKGVSLIGKVDFRGEQRDIFFASRNDRRRHFYIIGQTGTGKTSLLREMIRQDIQNGEGVAVIDPHGDLVEDTLANTPKERVEDIVLFEPFDMERPVGLNMLEYESPEQKDFAVQEMIAIFHKLFPPEIIGPMFEHYMRNAMLALMADINNPGTLVEIPRMFTDPDFMQERLSKVTDAMVRNFWLKEWRQTTGETRSDMLGYVVSKVGRFIENEMMRNIIGQSRCGFDLAKIMDEKKIFLANLSKGLTGEVNSSLLGLILVSKMQMAAMRRARFSEEERKDFYLYVDEFQNFTTDSISTILSEARKYRLNLILAHQYIPQLTDDIRNAVLGNVGTVGAYRVGADDAEFLEKQFEPEFSRFDLLNLDNFTLIIKMLIDNKVSSPFRMEACYPQEGNRKIIEPIKKIAKLKYGRPREAVEAEIIKRSKLMSL